MKQALRIATATAIVLMMMSYWQNAVVGKGMATVVATYYFMVEPR